VFLYDRRYRERLVCDHERNATGLVRCGLTGFECFFACDSMNAVDLVFEK